MYVLRVRWVIYLSLDDSLMRVKYDNVELISWNENLTNHFNFYIRYSQTYPLIFNNNLQDKDKNFKNVEWYFERNNTFAGMRTAVDVSKDTGKKPPADRWQGRMDFIIITFTSSRSIRPASSIGSTVHHPEYVASPIFELSSINPPQIYVKKIIWMKLPTMWKKKMRRIETGTFACVHKNYHSTLRIRVY